MTSVVDIPNAAILWPMSPDELEAAREAGREALRRAQETAPQHPLALIAWAQGWTELDVLQRAVTAARELGVKWDLIAAALGETSGKAAERRFGRGKERQRVYQQRRRDRLRAAPNTDEPQGDA